MKSEKRQHFIINDRKALMIVSGRRLLTVTLCGKCDSELSSTSMFEKKKRCSMKEREGSLVRPLPAFYARFVYFILIKRRSTTKATKFWAQNQSENGWSFLRSQLCFSLLCFLFSSQSGQEDRIKCKPTISFGSPLRWRGTTILMLERRWEWTTVCCVSESSLVR